MRLSLRHSAGAQRVGVSARQGIRQQRAMQSDVLHRGQPGAVPAKPGSAGHEQAGDHRQPCLLHGRIVRAVPLRHVRVGIPAGVAECRIRWLPRAALPAERWRKGRVGRSRTEVHGRFRHGHVQCAEPRRHHERDDLPHPSVRGREGQDRPRLPGVGRHALHHAARAQALRGPRRPAGVDGEEDPRQQGRQVGGLGQLAAEGARAALRRPLQGCAAGGARPTRRPSKSTACG